MVSFIVSYYNRPTLLMCVVGSLLSQLGEEFEIIITDNSTDEGAREFAKNLCNVNSRIKYIYTGDAVTPEDHFRACYISAEIGAKMAIGDWLCFPSDDSYYVPLFTHFMLNFAKHLDLEMVYCDMLYDPRWNGHCHTVVPVTTLYYYFDKNCFIVKKERFKGFSMIETPEVDWLTFKTWLKEGIRHGKAPGVMVVHN